MTMRLCPILIPCLPAYAAGVWASWLVSAASSDQGDSAPGILSGADRPPCEGARAVIVLADQASVRVLEGRSPSRAHMRPGPGAFPRAGTRSKLARPHTLAGEGKSLPPPNRGVPAMRVGTPPGGSAQGAAL